jgi:hypothetical protein
VGQYLLMFAARIYHLPFKVMLAFKRWAHIFYKNSKPTYILQVVCNLAFVWLPQWTVVYCSPRRWNIVRLMVSNLLLCRRKSARRREDFHLDLCPLAVTKKRILAVCVTAVVCVNVTSGAAGHSVQ